MMKNSTQILLNISLSIRKASILMLIPFLLMSLTVESTAQDKVLNIYFCGTGCSEMWWHPGQSAWQITGGNALNNPSELIATVYYNDCSSPIIKKISNKFIVTSVSTVNESNNYKYIVNGIGYGANLSWKELFGQANPSFGDRGWNELLDEAYMAFDKVAIGGSKVILNLIGFSRGGILCMKMADRMQVDERVKKINILAYDPVPGDLVPSEHGDFVLPSIVNQYIGVYAQNECSLFFEPVLPKLSETTKVWLTSVPGAHETIVGNCQKDGHAKHSLDWLGILDNSCVEAIKSVNNVAIIIAEQLLTSKEWGESRIINLAENSNEDKFKAQVDIMNGYTEWEKLGIGTVRGTTFTGFFSGHANVLNPQDKSPLLRLLWVVPAPWRLCFKAPLKGIDFVYCMEEEVAKITPQDWTTLQALRGDYFPPEPDLPILPVIRGECSVIVDVIPTATDEVAGIINGTTEDPLEYTEQGTYTITWIYDDGNANVSTQVQSVVVGDITPPVMEVNSTFPVRLWPPNHRYERISVEQMISSVADNCSNLFLEDIVITKVTSDEEEDIKSGIDGYTKNDIVIGENCKSVDLRRECNWRGNGRVYSIHLLLSDKVGNETTAICQYTVKVGLPNQPAIADTPVYEVYSDCYNTEIAPSNVVASMATKSSLTAEAIIEKEELLPEIGFIKNYPNPFNSNTTFTFGITETSDVTLSIYNMQGQLVRILYSGEIVPGSHNVDWNGTNEQGVKVASGIYIYRLLANNEVVATGKAVLRK